LPVARDDVLHELDHPHVRARLVGRAADARRRDGAGARARQAREPVVAAGDGRGLPPGRHSGARPRAGRMVPPKLVGPAPPDGLDARDRGGRPARAVRAAEVRRNRLGVRAHVRRSVRDAVLRPGPRAGVRPPLSGGRGAASMKRVVIAASLVALALPASAFAHASLQHTYPKFRQRVEISPSHVSLRFDQSVKALPNAIEVYSSHGDVVSLPAHNAKNPHYVVATLRRALPTNAYTVRWHVISGDGHVISGVYTFGVRMAAPPPTEAYGASGPTTTEDAVRWLYFLALALLVGGVGFRLLVARGPLPARAEQRFYAITGIGAIATLNVGILGFVLRAEDALQLPFGRLLYGDLSPIVSGTRFGTAFIVMTLGFALATAFLFIAWLTE